MSIRHLMKSLALLGTASLLATFAATTSQAEEQSLSLALRGADVGGQAAISALGGNLAAVAAQYGKTPEELRRLFRRDSTLRIDRNGKLFYKERAVKLPAAPSQRAGILDGAPYPLAQTFSLHSKPGSNRLLILNFQGATITGTFWNTAQGHPSIVATPFNTEGAASTFSDGERTAIQQIWQRVAEDYAPFDVDVTTDINAAASAPAGSRSATVVITRQSDYNVKAPGVAYTSTFGNAAYEPAFVAYDTLWKNPKYIAEAVSHELGHRLGLDHDGTRWAPYYSGHGTAPMTWAPIMGNSYAANITQFSKGEYANANNTQDDYLILGRFLNYRDDDAGNSPAQAKPFPTTLSGSTRSGTFDGIIERQNDADVFSIQAAAGPLTASVNPAALTPDLDAVLTLLDANGVELATDNPPQALNASLTYTITRPGTYYLKVTPTGYSTTTPAATIYSSYASRGNYRLAASFTATSSTPPTAAITATPAIQGFAPLNVTFSAAGSRPAGAITSYKWDLGNGATATTATASASYTAPGTYTVKLLVGSNGLSSGATKDIVVGKPFTTSLSVVRVANGDGTYSGVATVYRTTDATGSLVTPDPLVGTWSGGVRGTSQFSGMKRSGMSVVSPSTRDARACFTFTVNSLSGIDPAAWNFVETDTARKPRYLYLPQTPISATACPQTASR